MSLPPLVPPTADAWGRVVRDLVNAIARRVIDNGATASRPRDPTTGTMFYDTTLGKPIWFHASGVWKDAGGTTV